MRFFRKKVGREHTYIIEFYRKFIKIIRATKQNNDIIIDKIFSLDIEELSEQKIKEFFDNLFPPNHKFKLKTFVFRKDTTIKYIEFPSVSDDEIKKMVEFQIEKTIPYPADEISFDYKVQSVSEEGYSNVIMAIAHKKKISTIIDKFKEYQLNLDAMILDVDSLHNWFNYIYGESDNYIALVDVDGYNTNLIIIKEKRMYFSRSILVGYMDFDDGNNQYAINQLVDDIIRSLSTYEKKNNNNINKIVITGAENSFKYLKNVLNEKFEGSVETKSCFDKINLGFASEKLKKQGSEILSFVCMISAAFPTGQQQFNFLPYEIRFRKELEHKKKVIKKIGVVGIILIIVSIISLLGNFYLSSRRVELLDKRLQEINPEVEKVKEEVLLMRKLSDYLQERSFSLNILRELYTRIPDSVLLIRLKLVRNKTLVIRGETNKISDVFSFVKSLEKSSYFGKINADSVNVDEKTSSGTVTFELYCNLK